MCEVTPAGYAGVAGTTATTAPPFTMITVWDELKNVAAFAGPDPGQEWAVRG